MRLSCNKIDHLLKNHFHSTKITLGTNNNSKNVYKATWNQTNNWISAIIGCYENGKSQFWNKCTKYRECSVMHLSVRIRICVSVFEVQNDFMWFYFNMISEKCIKYNCFQILSHIWTLVTVTAWALCFASWCGIPLVVGVKKGTGVKVAIQFLPFGISLKLKPGKHLKSSFILFH